MMQGAAKRGRPRSFDPGDVLERALDVFWRQGFFGTSYADLTAATGLNKPSIYAAFGDKEALYAATLERYADGPQTALVAAFAESPHLVEGLRRMLRGYVDLYTGGDIPCGCMVSTALAEAQQPGFPTALRDRIASLAEVGNRRIAGRIARAVAEGELEVGADPSALTDFILTFGLGIAAASRVGGSRESLHAATETALTALPMAR